MDTYERMAFTNGLRDLANFIDALPDDSIILDNLTRYDKFNLYMWATNAQDFSSMVKELGNCEKLSDNSSLGAERKFGFHSFNVSVGKEQTCQKIETGEVKEIERIEYSDEYYAELEAIKARHKKLVKEPVVEWKCPESFLKIGE